VGRPKSSPEQIEKKRSEIVRAASKVFAEKGYAAAQIADIAAELGIGHGTVYRYFRDKRHVLDEVIDYAIGRVAASLAQDLPTADTLEAYRAQVVRIGEGLYRVVSEEKEIAALLFKEAFGADQELADRMYLAMNTFARFTEQYLINGQEKGFFRKDFNTWIAACAVNAMVFEGARQVLRADDPEESMRQWSRELPELYLRGLTAPAERAGGK
jgi:AcrR family transcriptional regulator